jgi:hypothetical protein
VRYGRHSVDDYDSEHPNDERVDQAREQVSKLNAQEWKQEQGEEPIDFKRRVEQSYGQVAEPYASADRDQDERMGARRQWIEDHKQQLSDQRQAEINAQRNNDLKSAAQVDRVRELEQFEKDAREGKNPDMAKAIDDLTQQQAARQEHITNNIAGPAMEEKLQELGLDKVEEPKPEPEPPSKAESQDDQDNADQIPEDVMATAAESRPADAPSDDRLARISRAYEQAGTPAPAAEGQSKDRTHELER